MSDFAPEDVTSPFAETDSSSGEVASVMHLPLYPNPLAEIVMEKEVARTVVRECLGARGESNEKEEIIDVVGGGEAGMRSGAESKGFTFVDAVTRSNLIAGSDRETIIDTSGMPT